MNYAKTTMICVINGLFSAFISCKNQSPANNNIPKEVISEEKTKTIEQSLLPTQEEINSINSKLPVLVADGTMFTTVEYDEETKIQTFYYDFTRDIDESMIKPEIIDQLKGNMVNALKNTNNEARINAGVTFLYVYRSIEKKVLYEILINANDLKNYE